MTHTEYRFDPIDMVEMHRWTRLSAGQRLQAMLNARELAMGFMRGRLRKRYPDLSLEELNLKLLAELERRDKRPIPSFQAIRQAKRTVVVLSNAYLADHLADFENGLAQTMGIQEGAYRLLPIRIEAIAAERLPTRLGMLTTLDLTHPYRSQTELARLVRALQQPLPRRT